MGTLADHQLRSNRDRLIGVGPVLIGLHDEVFDCLSEIVVFEPFGLAEKECYEAASTWPAAIRLSPNTSAISGCWLNSRDGCNLQIRLVALPFRSRQRSVEIGDIGIGQLFDPCCEHVTDCIVIWRTYFPTGFL
jgi:hypothetical protein